MRLFLIAAFFLPFLAFGQHQLNGRVINSAGEPIPGVSVLVDGTFKGASTDASGTFELFLPTGYYKLHLKHLTFKDKFVDQLLERSLSRDYSMTEATFFTDEVIVSSTRVDAKSPVANQTITSEEIDQRNLGQDIPILMNYATSVVSTSDAGAGVGYSGIRIRGSDQSRINVTLNGIPMNDPESQALFWVNTPDLSSSLQSIQIQRGLGSSTNGSGAFGASINMQSEISNANAGASFMNSFGSFNTHKHSLEFSSGRLKNNWKVYGRASLIQSDGFVDRASSDLKSYYLSAGYQNKKSVLKLIHFSGKELTYQSWYGTPQSRIIGDEEEMKAHALNEGYRKEQLDNLLSSDRTYNFYLYENEVDNYGQDHFQFHYARSLEKKMYYNGALHYTKGNGYFEQFRSNEEFKDYGVADLIIGADTISKTNLIRRRWLDNDFYGITSSFTLQEGNLNQTIGGAWSNYDGDHFGEVIWAKNAGDFNYQDRFYDNTGIKREWNIYSKSELKITGALNLFADLQMRSVDYSVDGLDIDRRKLVVDDQLLFFNPKIGAKLNWRQWNFGAYAGLGNREPSRNDYVDAAEGSIPQAESLIDVELSAERISTKTRLAANLYMMNYRDQLVQTGELNDVGTPIRINVPESQRLGIELEYSHKLTKLINVGLNLTLSQNEISSYKEILYDYTSGFDFIEINHSNTDISFSPEVISSAFISTNLFDDFELTFISKYVGKQYLDNTSSENKKVDPYFTTDLVAGYKIKTNFISEIDIKLMVNNLFNSTYESNGYTYSYIYGEKITENFYFPQAGINYLLGINLSL